MPITQVTFQEVVGGVRKLLVCAMRICACAHDHVCKIQCVKIFTVQKNSRKKISPLACIGEIGENFLLTKISVYIVPLSAMHRLGTDELTHARTCTPPSPHATVTTVTLIDIAKGLSSPQ